MPPGSQAKKDAKKRSTAAWLADAGTDTRGTPPFAAVVLPTERDANELTPYFAVTVSQYLALPVVTP